MAYFKFVEILPLVFALCFVPTKGQTGNMFGCLKGLVCNLEPFITQCCTESFQEETWSKKALKSCLFSVVQKEATACLTGSGRPTEPREEEDTTEGDTTEEVMPEQEENEGDSSIEREEYSETSTFRNFFRQRNREFGRRRNSGQKGYSDSMKNEDCQKLKTNQPNGTEECSAWSESVTRCVNQIPLVNFICQMGSGISGGFGQGNFGDGAFGGFGQGGFGGGGFGGFSQGGFGGGGFGGFGQGSSFGGMGNGGFGNGGQSPFGGMGNSGFGFGNKNSFGIMGNGGFGKGSFGDKGIPDFEMIGGDKSRPTFQSSDRGYDGLPEWKRRKHLAEKQRNY